MPAASDKYGLWREKPSMLPSVHEQTQERKEGNFNIVPVQTLVWTVQSHQLKKTKKLTMTADRL